MKKAVAHLIPFMEEERALKAQELKAQGLEITDEVNSLILLYMYSKELFILFEQERVLGRPSTRGAVLSLCVYYLQGP